MAPPTPISIAISTRDRADALANCLDALCAGTLLPTEIVVVDQSKDDITAAVVAARAAAPVPLVYVRQPPCGLAASQNLAIRRAASPIVAITDDDCIVAPDWLATIAAAFAAEPTLDVVTGRVLPLPAAGTKTYAVSSRTSTERRTFVGKALPWLIGSGNNFALKRSVFDAVGGCDERLGPGAPGLGGMDMDLFYRLLAGGARIQYEPTVLVYHERQTRAGRVGRRPLYGHGMGAFVVFWLRRGDLFALRILLQWLAMRLRLLLRAVLKQQWLGVYEEWLMLRSTAQGVRFALRQRTPTLT